MCRDDKPFGGKNQEHPKATKIPKLPKKLGDEMERRPSGSYGVYFIEQPYDFVVAVLTGLPLVNSSRAIWT